MNTHSRCAMVRMGFSLLELLIVLTILALILALLLPGIQKVRQAANQMKSSNSMKQLALATHNFAAANGDRLPRWQRAGRMTTVTNTTGITTTFIDDPDIMGIEARGLYAHLLDTKLIEFNRSLFVSSNDSTFCFADLFPRSPNITYYTTLREGDCSFVANGEVFCKASMLSSSIPDGLSSTCMLTERLSNCGEKEFSQTGSTTQMTQGPTLFRRATFADAWYPTDVVPVTRNSRTQPSVAGKSFRVNARFEDCDKTIPNAPQGVMLVALMDGSVRSLSAGMAPELFWGAVTPAGGEVLADW